MAAVSARPIIWRHALGVPLLLLALAGLAPILAQAPDSRDGAAPWRFCLKGQDPNAETVCFTGKGGVKDATDVEVTAEHQAKLKAELERRAEEARRRLQGGGAPPAAQPR